MGCVGSHKQIRLDSTIFQISRTNNCESTVDATLLQQNLNADQSISPEYLSLKINKTNSVIADPPIFPNSKKEKVNEHYKIIKPFLKKSKKDNKTKPKYFLVKHTITKVTYIMKVIKQSTITPDNFFILNFNKAFKNINHPNIIKYHEIFSDETNFYIISEYPNGYKTLEEELKNPNNFSEKQIKEIIQQILYGILHLHSLKIMNQSISLDNILVSKNQKKCVDVKLFNLEHANEVNKTKLKKTINHHDKINSINYMAPEALKNQYSTKSDIWSVGVIMYFLLYKQFPFEGDNLDEKISKIEQGKPELKDRNNHNERISPKAISLIKKMLLFSIEDRFNACQCLQHGYFDYEIIPLEHDGTCALIRYAINIIMKLRFHKKDFVNIRTLYNELIQKYNKIYISDIYQYLSEPLSKKQRTSQECNIELNYASFCDSLLTNELILNNSNISFVFDFIDKDTDNLINKNDFKVLFEYVNTTHVIDNKEFVNLGYYLATFEHKSMVFPEFKKCLTNYQKYINYL